MADRTAKTLIAGQSGCGKTTLIKALSAQYDRVLHWDIKGEYDGQLVTFADLPALFKKRAFRAVYRPVFARSIDDLPAEFNELAGLFLQPCMGCRNFLFTVDEAVFIMPNKGTGGLGKLFLLGRSRGISLFYATQYISTFPRILGATRKIFLFHLDGLESCPTLRPYLSDELVQRVAALPPHEYVTVTK